MIKAPSSVIAIMASLIITGLTIQQVDMNGRIAIQLLTDGGLVAEKVQRGKLEDTDLAGSKHMQATKVQEDGVQGEKDTTRTEDEELAEQEDLAEQDDGTEDDTKTAASAVGSRRRRSSVFGGDGRRRKRRRRRQEPSEPSVDKDASKESCKQWSLSHGAAHTVNGEELWLGTCCWNIGGFNNHYRTTPQKNPGCDCGATVMWWTCW